MKTFALLAVAAALALTGCAAAAPVATAEPVASFSTVEDLRDAFVAAGGDCGDWNQGDRIVLAAQSGDCSGNTVLSIYLSEANRDEVVSNLKALDVGGLSLLVGDNWIINTPEPEDYVDALGGIVVRST